MKGVAVEYDGRGHCIQGARLLHIRAMPGQTGLRLRARNPYIFERGEGS